MRLKRTSRSGVVCHRTDPHGTVVAFFTYRYPERGDPIMVAVDTITSDLILTRSPEVDPYVDLYGRLRDAALSPADTVDFLLGGDLAAHDVKGTGERHLVGTLLGAHGGVVHQAAVGVVREKQCVQLTRPYPRSTAH